MYSTEQAGSTRPVLSMGHTSNPCCNAHQSGTHATLSKECMSNVQLHVWIVVYIPVWEWYGMRIMWYGMNMTYMMYAARKQRLNKNYTEDNEGDSERLSQLDIMTFFTSSTSLIYLCRKTCRVIPSSVHFGTLETPLIRKTVQYNWQYICLT